MFLSISSNVASSVYRFGRSPEFCWTTLKKSILSQLKASERYTDNYFSIIDRDMYSLECERLQGIYSFIFIAVQPVVFLELRNFLF